MIFIWNNTIIKSRNGWNHSNKLWKQMIIKSNRNHEMKKIKKMKC